MKSGDSSSHPFLARVIANKELKYEDGCLSLMGSPGCLLALNTLAATQEALRREFGASGASVFYHMLGYQAGNAAKLMRNRFGFPVEQAMKLQADHLAMIGAGSFSFVRTDFKANMFVLRGESNFAREYAKVFGVQKDAVDWMIKGGVVYLLNEYLDRTDFVCVETSCVAKGNKYCEFVARPKKSFSKAELKGQEADKLKMDLVALIAKNALGMPKRR